jgi:hypothetical protein
MISETTQARVDGTLRPVRQYERRASAGFTYRPVNDGPSLRDAVRKALDAWHRSGDTYRFGVDVQNAVAAFDYNTKKANNSMSGHHRVLERKPREFAIRRRVYVGDVRMKCMACAMR